MMVNIMKEWVYANPKLFYPIHQLCSRFLDIDGDTTSDGVEIVIEGFPRSANTFAVLAFKFAQGRDVPTASHFHAEAQILRGVELGIPVIVLVRHPVDAIGSLMVRHPDSVSQYARRYINFYSNVLRVREHFVLADFRQVTQDFGAVIAKINAKFSMEFNIYENSKKNDEAIFQKIDEINRQREGGKLTHLARPIEFRGNTKVSIDRNNSLILEAVRLYEKMMNGL